MAIPPWNSLQLVSEPTILGVESAAVTSLCRGMEQSFTLMETQQQDPYAYQFYRSDSSFTTPPPNDPYYYQYYQLNPYFHQTSYATMYYSYPHNHHYQFHGRENDSSLSVEQNSFSQSSCSGLSSVHSHPLQNVHAYDSQDGQSLITSEQANLAEILSLVRETISILEKYRSECEASRKQSRATCSESSDLELNAASVIAMDCDSSLKLSNDALGTKLALDVSDNCANQFARCTSHEGSFGPIIPTSNNESPLAIEGKGEEDLEGSEFIVDYENEEVDVSVEDQLFDKIPEKEETKVLNEAQVFDEIPEKEETKWSNDGEVRAYEDDLESTGDVLVVSASEWERIYKLICIDYDTYIHNGDVNNVVEGNEKFSNKQEQFSGGDEMRKKGDEEDMEDERPQHIKVNSLVVNPTKIVKYVSNELRERHTLPFDVRRLIAFNQVFEKCLKWDLPITKNVETIRMEFENTWLLGDVPFSFDNMIVIVVSQREDYFQEMRKREIIQDVAYCTMWLFYSKGIILCDFLDTGQGANLRKALATYLQEIMYNFEWVLVVGFSREHVTGIIKNHPVTEGLTCGLHALEISVHVKKLLTESIKDKNEYVDNVVHFSLSLMTTSLIQSGSRFFLTVVGYFHHKVSYFEGACGATIQGGYSCKEVDGEVASWYRNHIDKASNTVAADKIINHINKNYFGSYSSCAFLWNIISDEIRTDANGHTTLEDYYPLEGVVVRDIGCGTIILSLFAAHASVSRMVGVEASEKITIVIVLIARGSNFAISNFALNNGVVVAREYEFVEPFLWRMNGPVRWRCYLSNVHKAVPVLSDALSFSFLNSLMMKENHKNFYVQRASVILPAMRCGLTRVVYYTSLERGTDASNKPVLVFSQQVEEFKNVETISASIANYNKITSAVGLGLDEIIKEGSINIFDPGGGLDNLRNNEAYAMFMNITTLVIFLTLRTRLMLRRVECNK